MNHEFENFVVLVTGSFRGNGRAILQKFLDSGAIVYGIDKNYKKNKSSDNLHEIKADLTNKKELNKIFNHIKKKEKKLDILINNAGISLDFNKKKPIFYWDKTLEVNLTLPFLMSHYFLSLLKKSENANIINISSLGSKIAMSNNPAYNASKSGLLALTFSFATDYSKYGIRVNSISPGYIKTNMTMKSYKNKDKYKARLDRMMIKKYGSTEDIANAVLFLCSPKSKYINAEDLVVDGGLLKKGI